MAGPGAGSPADDPARALFVRAGALGDFVVSLPVLAALLAEGPVDVVCGARFAALLPLVPGAARVGRVWDVGAPEAGWIFGAGPPPGAWTRAAAFSAGTADALLRLGIPDVRAAAAVPTGPVCAHFAAPFGLVAPVPRLRVVDPAPPAILLAPGAGGAAKRQPRAWWTALAARLGDLPVVWVLGPQEAGEDWPGTVLRPDLVETARRAARAVWVGADSGPAHLAVAAGARAIVSFLHTDPAVWCPPGARAVGPEATPEEVAGWTSALWKSTVQDDSGGASG